MTDPLIIIAQVLGPVALVASLGLLCNRTKITTIIREYMTNESLHYMTNMIRMMIGLFIITIVPLYNRIHIIMHVLGWIAIVLGTSGLLFPEVNKHTMKMSISHTKTIQSMILIGLVIGGGLCYIGYMM